MRFLFFFIGFIGVSHLSFAQTFTGTVYGDDELLNGVVVQNQRTTILTTTDTQGRFAIEAKTGDTLSFQFFTHHDKRVVLRERDRNNFVVELTAKVNVLDEVVLEKEFVFEEERFQQDFDEDIARDIALHPEKYEYNNNPNGNFNFVNIGRALWRLINKNKISRPKPFPKIPITLDQYVLLFKEDRVINDTFLVETLQIPLDKKALFIDFCISKRLDTSLLVNKNKFLLMDRLVTISVEFLTMQQNK